MDEIEEFSDARHKAWCIHCRASLGSVKTSRDHVPTKTLLRPPYPANLPIVLVCHDCNQGFRKNEEYLVAFLSVVISGTTDPELQVSASAARILRHNTQLRAEIELAKREYKSRDGQDNLIWNADLNRIVPVVVKNARGHAFYEYGEPMLDDPESVLVVPLPTLTASERASFEEVPDSGAWPEVGSRMMTRVMTGQDLDGSWIVVQEGSYRFAVTQADGGLVVRSILSEYLATEVRWS